MPTITLNKQAVFDVLGKKLSDEELKDRIAMLGTDLEEINKEEIHVEIFPDRPDLLSEQGFSRALSSFLGIKKGLPSYEVKPSGKKVVIDPSVTMRPFTVCAIVKGLTFTDTRIKEIMQLQEKLATTHGRRRKKSGYGIYPLDKISFPVRYVAKDPKDVTFQPLGHEKAIPASEIEEIHDKGIMYKEITKEWKQYPFFIDSENKVLSMLPFTNSHDVGKVDETTKDVFVECSGTDLENVQIALNIIVTMLADMGGSIESVEMEYKDQKVISPSLEPQEMNVSKEYAEQVVGVSFSEEDLKNYLGMMGMDYANGIAKYPAYRGDILHPIDIVEDITIAYGYENVEARIPNVATVARENPLEKFKDRIIELSLGLGISETYSYTLVNSKRCKEYVGLTPEIILANSISEEFDCLRPSLIPSVMETLNNNRQHTYPQHILDSGPTFLKDESKETGVREDEMLSVALIGEEENFTTARQVLGYIMAALDHNISIKEYNKKPFFEGRAGTILSAKEIIGHIGEIHPEVIEAYGLEYPVSLFEINLTKLYQQIYEE